MAKGSRGGQRAGGGLSGAGNIQQQQASSAQQPQIDNTQQASAFSASYDQFMAMTDDQKATVIESAISQSVPAHLAQNSFQSFIYNSGLNEKPDIVDDKTLNSMNGTELWRTVNNVYDRQNDISYNADQIARQIQAGRVTRVSDSGGSVYGRGIYFADSRSSSGVYGNARGNVKKTAVVRCKLNNNAKVISYSQAQSGAKAEIRSGSKLGRALAKCDSASQSSVYAMAKGYNVMTSGHGYYNVLNRNAVTMSSSVDPL